jgi:hypothetical protein
MPPWVIAMVIIAALCWISPMGLIVAAVMLGVLVTAHPTFALAIGGTVALIIVIALRERWHGRPF